MSLAIQRRFTRAGESPYAAIAFRLASSEIRSPDGSVVFRLDRLEAPSGWSQVAVDVLAQKYFRKAGVPARLKAVLRRACRPGYAAACADERGARRAARGRALRQRDQRAAGVRPAGRNLDLLGLEGRLFRGEDDARAFYDELRYMLARQMAAPNSPQWFNTGLHWAYGIDGPAQGHFYVDEATGEVRAVDLGL